MNGKRTTRTTIRIRADFYDKVEDFREENGLASWVEALRFLTTKGLKKVEEETKK